MTGATLPPPGTIDVWWVDRRAEAPTASGPHAAADVSVADQIGSAGRRSRFLQARRALRRIICAHYIDVATNALDIALTGGGKPFLTSAALAFNTSHCGPWTVFAFAKATTIGVDAACDADLDVSSEAALVTIASAPETKALAALKDARAARRRLWVSKEAVGKALGRGLLADLPGVDIGLDTASPRAVSTPQGTLLLIDCPAPAGVTAALCIAGSFESLRIRSGKI